MNDTYTLDQWMQGIAAAERAGDREAADYLRAKAQAALTGTGTFTERVGAGVADVGSKLGQTLGLTTKGEGDEQERIARMADPGGWGRMAGGALALAPAALIPGANTIAGAGAINAALGAALEPEDPLKGALIGGAVGAGLTGVMGKALPKAWSAAKEQIATRTPFMPAERERIAERAFTKMLPDPDKAPQELHDFVGRTMLQQPPKEIPGFQQTTAALSGDPTLLAAERQLREAAGELGAPLRARSEQQAKALEDAWMREFGNKVAPATAARDAFAETATAGMTLSPRRLQSPDAFMPVFKRLTGAIEASTGKVRNALEALRAETYDAVQIAQRTGNYEPLHQLRMVSFDDLLTTINREGAPKSATVLRGVVNDAKGLFDAEMDALSGGKWGRFMQGYAKRAQALSQAEAGEAMLGKLASRPTHSTGTPQPGGLMPELRRDFGGGSTPIDARFKAPIYSPSGERLLSRSLAELERAATPYAADIGPRGSATAMNLAPMHGVLQKARGAQARAERFSMGEAGTFGAGSLGAAIGNPGVGAALMAGVLAKHYGLDPMRARALNDVAERLVSYFTDPQKAAEAANRLLLKDGERAYVRTVIGQMVPLIAGGATAAALAEQR